MISEFRIRVTNDTNISSPRAGAPDSAYLASYMLHNPQFNVSGGLVVYPLSCGLMLASAWSSVSGLGWERDCADLSAWVCLIAHMEDQIMNPFARRWGRMDWRAWIIRSPSSFEFGSKEGACDASLVCRGRCMSITLFSPRNAVLFCSIPSPAFSFFLFHIGCGGIRGWLTLIPFGLSFNKSFSPYLQVLH